jgi:uncharacterized protein YodC (DUF2158 family)
MAEEFKKGDVVVLKSGGPRMTVSQTGEDSYGEQKVWCVWFERNTKHEDTFDPAVLSNHTGGGIGMPFSGTASRG